MTAAISDPAATDAAADALPWETDPHLAALDGHARLVGTIAMQWTEVEQLFPFLVHAYLLRQGKAASAVTLHLNAPMLTNMLLALAELEGHAGAQERIGHAVKLFEANGANRNLVVHCAYHVLARVDAPPVILAASETARRSYKVNAIAAPVDVLRPIVQEIVDFQRYLRALVPALEAALAGGEPAWPAAIAVPDKRGELPRFEPGAPLSP